MARMYICVCHTEHAVDCVTLKTRCRDAGRLHEAHNARVEIAYLRACRAGLS